MIKNKVNRDNKNQITNLQEHKEYKSRGVYVRDDHCDWGSSGMNEFTEEFSEDK